MDLKRLRYFLAVAELEHFGKASRLANVVQPALTRQIKQLETDLGVTLFERSKRYVALTDAGRHFQNHAREILAQYERACSEVRLIANGRLGSLTLGFIEVAAWHGVVPETIRAYRESAREVQLILRSMTSVDQLTAIRAEKLDCGFLYNGPEQDAELGHRLVAEHRIELAVPNTSALASRQSARLQDVSDRPLVWFVREQSIDFHDALVAALESAGVARNIVYEAENEAIMLALVNSGMAVALVNEGQKWRLPGGVVMLPVDDLGVRLRLGFFWHRSNTKPTLRQFRQVLSKNGRTSLPKAGV